MAFYYVTAFDVSLDLSGTTTFIAAGTLVDPSTERYRVLSAVTGLLSITGTVVPTPGPGPTPAPTRVLPVTVSGTAPVNPQFDDVWFDDVNNIEKRWNGTAWIAAGSAAYAPLTTSVWVPATMLSPVLATPTITTNNRRVYWTMDPTTTQAVGATVFLPAEWLTFDAQIWWLQVFGGVNGTDQVTWRLDYANDVIAGTQNTQPTGAPANASTVVLGQYVDTVTTARTSLAHDGTKGTSLVVMRVATDAADTWANPALLIGVKLLKTS